MCEINSKSLNREQIGKDDLWKINNPYAVYKTFNFLAW